MRKFLGLVAVLAVLSGVSAPRAEAVAFLYLDPSYSGPILFHFNGVDTSSIYPAGCVTVAGCDAAQLPPGTPIPGGTSGVIGGAPGEDSWGVFRVSSITKPDLTPLWLPTATQELTGIFYGVQDYQVSVFIDPITGNPIQQVRSTGLGGDSFLIDVYFDNTPDAINAPDPALRVGNDYPNFTDGELFLQVESVPGADAQDPIAHLAALFNPSTSTGSSKAFGDVVAGSFAPAIVPDTVTTNIGTQSDIGFSFIINPAGNPDLSLGASPWTVQFNDPAVTTVDGRQVPEPASLVLLGTSLLGLAAVGFARRRR